MKITQEQQILNHLLTHGEITSWEAITDYRITRLASIIFILRENYDIATEIKTSNNGKQYGLYILRGSLNKQDRLF